MKRQLSMLNYGESNSIDMYPMLTSGFKPTFNVLYSYKGKFRIMSSFDKGIGLKPDVFTRYLEEEIEQVLNRSESK